MIVVDLNLPQLHRASSRWNKDTRCYSWIFQAIRDQDWNKARNYSIYGSNAWGTVEEFEEHFYFDNLNSDGNLNINTNEIIIDGEYAKAYVYGNAIGEFTFFLEYLFTSGGSIFIPEEGEASGEGEGWFYLQKTENDWKLYSFGYIPSLPEEPPV